jgi:transcriptional regulator with PAS, ATPase and Fis domain
LIQNNDLAMPDVDSYKGKMSTSTGLENFSFLQQKPDHRQSDVTTFAMDDRPSIVIHTPGDEKYHDAETVDEMVSLESMEKFMIKKALKKYNNRRKEAADELGISERTLYRKIKEYDIPD